MPDRIQESRFPSGSPGGERGELSRNKQYSNLSLVFLKMFFVNLFLRETERKCEGESVHKRGRGRERGRHRI